MYAGIQDIGSLLLSQHFFPAVLLLLFWSLSIFTASSWRYWVGSLSVYQVLEEGTRIPSGLPSGNTSLTNLWRRNFIKIGTYNLTDIRLFHKLARHFSLRRSGCNRPHEVFLPYWFNVLIGSTTYAVWNQIGLDTVSTTTTYPGLSLFPYLKMFGMESHHMVSVSMKYRLSIVWGVNMSLLSNIIFWCT